MASTKKRYVTVESPAVPIVTDRQLATVADLVARLEALRDDLEEAVGDLQGSLKVLQGENEPEGWERPVRVEVRDVD